MKSIIRNRIAIAIGLALITIATATIAAADGPKLIAAFFVKGKVGLKWQMIDGVAEYQVYRKAQDGEFAVVSTTDEDHYFDTDIVPGNSYRYKIGIVGTDGKEAFSSEKLVAIPGGRDTGEFTPPKWVGMRLDQDKIYLNWDPTPGAIAYNIHRSSSSGSGYEVVGNSQSSKYADKSGLEKGTTYYYVLSALNADFEETELSEEQAIKYGMTMEEQEALLAEAEKIELEPVHMEELFEVTGTGSGGPMNQPADVFVNSQGNIYITDALNARVNCFDPEGKLLFAFGEKTDDADFHDPPPSTFQIPFTLFIDSKDQVYVTDINGHDIQVFAADGTFIRRIKVQVEEGKAELRPNGIHVLEDSRIVLTDTGNHRFLIINQEGEILLSIGERGSETSQFLFPDELTVTGDNTICIVDVINCRIQLFNLEGEFIRTFGGVGQTAGTFARPKGITVDETGRIWVSDGMSSVIQSFTPEGEVKSALGSIDDDSPSAHL